MMLISLISHQDPVYSRTQRIGLSDPWPGLACPSPLLHQRQSVNFRALSRL